MLSEMYIEGGFHPREIIKAIHNPGERIKWDKDIEFAQVMSILNNKTMLWHQKNKSPIAQLNRKDYLEKKMKFSNDRKYYIFISSIPDDMQPAERTYTRATTIIGFQCFEKLDDGRVKFTVFMQNDYNQGNGAVASLSKAAVINQMPKTMKKWMEQL